MKVGQKVVCVRDDWADYRTNKKTTGPKKGDIVTISEIFILDIYTCLRFIEWPINSMGRNPSYNSTDFRPIDYSFGEQTAERIEKELVPETVEV